MHQIAYTLYHTLKFSRFVRQKGGYEGGLRGPGANSIVQDISPDMHPSSGIFIQGSSMNNIWAEIIASIISVKVGLRRYMIL